MVVCAESLEIQSEGRPPRVGVQEPVQDPPARGERAERRGGAGSAGRAAGRARPLPVPPGIPKSFGERIPVDLQLRDLGGWE